MRTFPVASLAIAAALAAPLPLSAQVKVVGGPFATGCSQLALAGSDAPEAITICTYALDNDVFSSQDAAKTLVNRGVIQMRRKAWVAAERDFAAAQSTMPQLAEIYVNRGAALNNQGKYHEALPQLSRGITLNPWEPEKAYFDRALAREATGDLAGAKADYEMAASLKPGWTRPAEALRRFGAP